MEAEWQQRAQTNLAENVIKEESSRFFNSQGEFMSQMMDSSTVTMTGDNEKRPAAQKPEDGLFRVKEGDVPDVERSGSFSTTPVHRSLSARRKAFQSSMSHNSFSASGNFSSGAYALERNSAARSWTEAALSRRGFFRSSTDSSQSFEISRHQSSISLRKADDARSKVKDLFKDSSISDLSETLPFFDFSELTLGKYLGRGAFCRVEEVQGIRLSSNLPDTSFRRFVATHSQRPSGELRYAIKRVKPDILKDKDRCWAAAVDLVVETRVLNDLEHPHIVKLRGMAGGDPYENKDYFLLLDRLHDTLTKRIGAWKRDQKSLVSRWGFVPKSKREMYQNLLVERISKAYDLSSAIAYLHRKKICHRDIKPDNIALDFRGDIKLFDFGLARELPPDSTRETVHNFTAMTGSLRFMAPEVAIGDPYNESCDVYSFSILFWEMLSCSRPYKRFEDETKFIKAVFVKQQRPRIRVRLWPEAIQSILRGGWEPEVDRRHSMARIERALHDEVVHLRDGKRCSFMDKNFRRSTFVFRQSSMSSRGVNSGDGLSTFHRDESKPTGIES